MYSLLGSEHVVCMIYMTCLLTAIGFPPGGSSTSTVHIYTQTIHRTTQNKQYIEQHKNFGSVRAVPRLCELYPGICLITEEKARKNLCTLNGSFVCYLNVLSVAKIQ
jgi:hypothetical protein